MTTRILLGLDVGTSNLKVLATTLSGGEIIAVAATTVWQVRAGVYTETDPEALAASVLALLDQACSAAAELIGPVEVAGIAITGMAEGGVLLESAEPGARPLQPLIAWFDPRGGREILQLPAQVLAEFCGRTGLPVSSLATIAKLAWMRGQGIEMAGRRWLNVPEFLAHRLGGVQAGELSLVARTGLLDQDSQELWPEALAAIGADRQLVAPLVSAGTPLGRAGGAAVPASLHGAVLAVAGHDHPVAAVGCGVVGADELFDSFGTAEALVRSVDGNLGRAARERLAVAGINSVHHVLEGRRVLLAGTKAGLLLRRTLRLLGATEPDQREALDLAACALFDAGPAALEGISVTGAANNDGVLQIAVAGDTVTPAALWLAALSHGVDEAARCLQLMAAEVGPAGPVTVAGGWSRMLSVRQSKQHSLPNVRFSDRSQAGAFGAAMFAAHAARQADLMAATGDESAISIDHPIGPSEQFAAQFTGAGHGPVGPSGSGTREHQESAV